MLAGLAFIIGFEMVGVSGWAKRVSLALKVGHELRCMVERFTQRAGEVRRAGSSCAIQWPVPSVWMHIIFPVLWFKNWGDIHPSSI